MVTYHILNKVNLIFKLGKWKLYNLPIPFINSAFQLMKSTELFHQLCRNSQSNFDNEKVKFANSDHEIQENERFDGRK